MSPHIKKLRTPEYNHFEVTQLLFEAFLDIIKNKRDIQEKRLSSFNSRSDRKIFVRKLDFVLGEHDAIRGQS